MQENANNGIKSKGPCEISGGIIRSGNTLYSINGKVEDEYRWAGSSKPLSVNNVAAAYHRVNLRQDRSNA